MSRAKVKSLMFTLNLLPYAALVTNSVHKRIAAMRFSNVCSSSGTRIIPTCFFCPSLQLIRPEMQFFIGVLNSCRKTIYMLKGQFVMSPVQPNFTHVTQHPGSSVTAGLIQHDEIDIGFL